MPGPILRQPSLIALSSDSQGSSGPRIRGRRCDCGHLFHPPHAYGCERCGRSGAATHEVEMDPVGALTALAEVRVHPKLPTPFTLGRVTLDGGPTLDVWLEDASRLSIGSRVRGRLVASKDANGGDVFDCRFFPEEGAR